MDNGNAVIIEVERQLKYLLTMYETLPKLQILGVNYKLHIII